MEANNAGLILLKMNWDNHRWEGWLWWYEEVGSSSLQEKNKYVYGNYTWIKKSYIFQI